MHEQGAGTTRSAETAFQLWRESATNGLACSQEALGDCYAEGIGVGKDLASAYAWYSIALMGDDQDELSNYLIGKKRKLEEQLEETSIKAAQRIIDAYAQKSPGLK